MKTLIKTSLLCLALSSLTFPVYGAYKDGTYTGVGNGKGGRTKVQVVVTGGKIAEVKILRHSDTDSIMAGPAMELPEKMVKQNTPEVADVGGATESSKGIKEAVRDALKKAQ